MFDTKAQSVLAGGDTAHAIQVYMLGVFRVLVRGDALGDDAWHRKKARQLFKFLLGRPNRRIGKEVLIEVLWPGSDPDMGSTNLRSAVHALRHALGTLDVVFADRHSVWILPDTQLWLDADEFEHTLELARQASDPLPLLQRADAMYTGDYLPEDLYEDWATERRDELKRAWTSLQFQLAQHWESRGDADAAAHSMQRLLQADPCDERAARELMRLLTRHGRRSEAVRVYQRLVRALREDLDVEPSETTTVLFETELPADATSRMYPLHNLPAQPGVFVGRGQDLAAAKAHILRSGVRLLTFLGPGGCGKTRLALHLASELLGEFPDGVWFVDLSTVRDADQIAFAIGRLLDVAQPVNGRAYLQRLIHSIGQKHVLLIVDNFEQVMAGGPQLAQLVADCPNLKVLATSREALHLRWEHQFQVPPLAAPGTPMPTSVEAIGNSPAVSLFVYRAQAIKPDWRLSDENAAAVAELCTRLDCLPLAIELAAARIKLFSPEAMLARMDQRLELLTSASRDVPERHQGLRRAIDWSHHLLSEQERTIFRDVAVFSGGWTLDGAIHVCTQSSGAGAHVLRHLEALVDKSLMRVELQRDGEPRFSLLDTIREFAFGELAKSGELTAKRRLHANWCAQLAEAAETRLTGPTQMASLELLEHEHDNVRASLRWSLDGGDPPLGVRLATAMGKFWEMRGYLQEAYQWLQRAVSIRDSVPIAARANLCRVAGHVAFLRSEYPQAQALLEESLDLSSGAEDPRGVVQALINLALLALMQADDRRGSALLRESLQVAINVADNASVASSLNLLGLVAYHRGQLAEAHSLLEQSLELGRAEGNAWGTAQALCNLGQVLRAEGFEAPARALHLESLQIWRELSDDWGLAYALEGFALLFGRSNPERAVRLIAVATTARERVGIRALPGRERDLQETLRACGLALGDEAQAAAWSAGQTIGLDAAIEDVFETIGHD